MSKLKYYARNVAATHDENPPSVVSLHVMGSLFWVSVKKTRGNEVADYRDSTSSSGAEYSRCPTENIYGEDVFVSESVWYDNEDDKSLDNKPCDRMGLDSLADNIISAESPDDDDEIFDTN